MKFREKGATWENGSVCLHHKILSPEKTFSKAVEGLCGYQAMLFSKESEDQDGNSILCKLSLP